MSNVRYLDTSNSIVDNNFIDALKGFLIVLVVLGHELQMNYTNFDQLFLFKFIYAFHMPLFMIVSGYLAKMSLLNSGCSVQKCVKKKFIYLVVPFVAWYIIGVLIDGEFLNLFNKINDLIIHIDNGLWYLYILFLCYVLLYIVNRLKYKYLLLIVFVIVLPMTPILGMNLLKWYLIFFVIGMFLFDFKKEIEVILKSHYKNILYVVPVVFMISLIFWERGFTDNSLFLSSNYLNAYKIFVALVGSISVYLMTQSLFKIYYLCKIFSLFGKYSMKIYIFNFIIIGCIYNFYSVNNQIYLIVNAFFITYFIILLSQLFSKISYFSILLGDTYKAKK